MRIFDMTREVERYQWLTMVRESDFNVLADLEGSSASAEWKPLAAEWIDEGRNARKPRSDFPPLGTTPTLSRRAVDSLLDLLVENGELLPLSVPGEPYFVYNVTRSVDALDEDRSEIARFSSGRIMEVNRYELDRGKFDGQSIFRLPQVRGQVFVGEPFVKRVEDAGLTGFVFREIWNG